MSSYHHLLECIEKSNNSIAYAVQKKEDLNKTIGETMPKLEKLIKQTKELKVNVEKALSKQYSGRIVNIIGEINNI